MGELRSTLRTTSFSAVAEPILPALRLVKPAGDQPSPQAALEELERLLASSDFDGTPRSREFLRFILEETLGGREDGLTQTALATRVFGRRQDFDPTIDPIVRIQAGRLRRSLERYYLLAGPRHALRIDLPRGGYVPVVKWATGHQPSGAGERGGLRKLDDWPSVVVGPFRAGGTGVESDRAELQFCERLAVELGRYADVRVALRSELDKLEGPSCDGGRFALSGHISRQAGDGWTSIARLVDCRNARQVWAEELRGDGAETESHDDVSRRIAARVASEHGVVARTLWAERRGNPPSEPTSYDAILRSYEVLLNRDASEFGLALESLQRVVAADPECALAWVQLSRLCAENYACDIRPVETPIDLAVRAARNGVRLDPFGQRSRTALAHALFVKGELQAARVETLRALELDPQSFANIDTIGWLLTLQGDAERGPALVRKAIARNPNHSPIVYQALWAEQLRRGEFEESRRSAYEYRDRSSFWPGIMRACSLGHLGSFAEARSEAVETLQRKPDFGRRGRGLIGRLIRLPELFARVLEGLAKAGLTLE